MLTILRVKGTKMGLSFHQSGVVDVDYLKGGQPQQRNFVARMMHPLGMAMLMAFSFPATGSHFYLRTMVCLSKVNALLEYGRTRYRRPRVHCAGNLPCRRYGEEVQTISFHSCFGLVLRSCCSGWASGENRMTGNSRLCKTLAIL